MADKTGVKSAWRCSACGRLFFHPSYHLKGNCGWDKTARMVEGVWTPFDD